MRGLRVVDRGHTPPRYTRPLSTHHVFLIPGFFGFANFGRLVYFSHVREFLEDAFARERLQVEIHRVRLGPTSSLRARAGDLLRVIQQTAPAAAPLHLIGHSSGGLDARLLTTPGLALDDGVDSEAVARRIRSVVCVATPHRGTPLAAFFSSLMGQHILRLLSLATITVLRQGRVPVGLLARAGAILTRIVVTRSSPPLALLDHLEAELLGRLGADREQIEDFAREVQGDRALVPQLTPATMDLFDATTSDRPDTRYACVTARAVPPRLATRMRLGASPWAHATYSLYGWLHRQIGEGDAIVPIASQRRGHVLFEGCGDHLDVIGHFGDTDHVPHHHDWLTTGSGFDRAQFEALWGQVAGFVADG